MIMESDDVFEVLRKASIPLDAFVSERTPENPHPFEKVIKTCNEKYGVDATLSSLEKLLYNTDKSELRDSISECICYAYEDKQDLWFEILIKYIISDTADYYNYLFLSNHISGFDVETRDLYQELHNRLPINTDKYLDAATEIISLDLYEQVDKQSGRLISEIRGNWTSKYILNMLTWKRYADMNQDQLLKCFKFIKNHPISNGIIINVCDELLQGGFT